MSGTNKQDQTSLRAWKKPTVNKSAPIEATRAGANPMALELGIYNIS